MGRELKGTFVAAGFADIRAEASFEFYGTADDIYFLHGVIVGCYFAPKTKGAAIQHGLASEEQFEDRRRSLDESVDEPGALAAFAWGQAIERKPKRLLTRLLPPSIAE